MFTSQHTHWTSYSSTIFDIELNIPIELPRYYCFPPPYYYLLAAKTAHNFIGIERSSMARTKKIQALRAFTNSDDTLCWNHQSYVSCSKTLQNWHMNQVRRCTLIWCMMLMATRGSLSCIQVVKWSQLTTTTTTRRRRRIRAYHYSWKIWRTLICLWVIIS